MSSLLNIKQQAITLFAEKGYEATTLNDIAFQVGIKKPSLYVYFKSKQELFLSVFDELLQEYELAVQHIFDEAMQATADQQLFILFEKYILWFAEERTKSLFWNRVLLFPPAELKDEIMSSISTVEMPLLQKEMKLIERLITLGEIREGNTEDVLLSFRSLREGLLMTFIINPDLEQEKIKEVWERYWNGLN